MIITKTPVRISLGAGATDLPFFYQKYGAKFVTSAASKYVYVMVHPHSDKVVWTGLLHSERVDSADQISNRIVNKVLQWMDLKKNIEIVSVSDAPPNSGLGNSSSFIVGLLKALHAYKEEFPWPEEIAQEACFVEQNLLNEYSGKQDAYAASLGGIIWLEISTSGNVLSSRLKLRKDFIDSLSENLVFANTGLARNSSDIQVTHKSAMDIGNKQVEGALKEISEIAVKIRRALESEDVKTFGELMGQHWISKAKLSRMISNEQINSIYKLATSHGAIGGNLMGAGGGGHFMFVCPDKKTAYLLSSALSKEGLQLLDMRFEMRGSTVTDRL